jgi:type IV pilus assembly protein PilE
MKRNPIMKGKLKAFTLTELLVVLVIIGILVLLALPSLMPLISKAKSTEAQLQLEHLYTLEKTYFYEHSKYSNSLNDVGFEQQKLTTDGGNANYKIEITDASGSSFKGRATAVVDFNGNGTFNVWEIDQEKSLKETIKD